jgi:hypothetical protein
MGTVRTRAARAIASAPKYVGDSVSSVPSAGISARMIAESAACPPGTISTLRAESSPPMSRANQARRASVPSAGTRLHTCSRRLARATAARSRSSGCSATSM